MSTKPVEAGKIAACVAQSNSSTLEAREIAGVKLAEKFRRKQAHTQSSTEEGEDGTITVKLHAAQERELVRFYLATEQLRETVALDAASPALFQTTSQRLSEAEDEESTCC
jgi:hypothetical protein